MTNQEIVDSYLNSIALLSVKTVKNRICFLNDLLRDFEKPFTEITKIDIRDYIMKKKADGVWKQATTVAQKILLLKIFFKYLINENLIETENNPMKGMKSPHQDTQGQLRTFNVDEIKILLKTADSSMIEIKNKLLFYLAMTSGLRANEICMIQKKHIDMDKRLIYMPKEDVKGHYREKLVPISNHTKDLINIYITKYPNNTDYLFSNRFGRCIAPGAVWMATKTVIDCAYPYKNSWKKPFGPHCCRHTFASRWIESGGDYHALKAIMGWKSFSEFNRYVSVSPEFISKAASKVERKLLRV